MTSQKPTNAMGNGSRNIVLRVPVASTEAAADWLQEQLQDLTDRVTGEANRLSASKAKEVGERVCSVDTARSALNNTVVSVHADIAAPAPTAAPSKISRRKALMAIMTIAIGTTLAVAGGISGWPSAAFYAFGVIVTVAMMILLWRGRHDPF
jgi:hypothetical protein